MANREVMQCYLSGGRDGDEDGYEEDLHFVSEQKSCDEDGGSANEMANFEDF